MKRWLSRRREPETEPSKPNAYDLWVQAGGNREEYRRLLREHGLIRELAPGETREPLPCGWPGPANGTATGDDFAPWADESLEIARETFPAVAETWPEWDGPTP